MFVSEGRAKMIYLREIEVEIAKISNCQGSALSGVVCLDDLFVGQKDVLKSLQKVLVLEKGLAHDCYHICFPKSCCAGRHAWLVC